jgi:Cu2+-exporting ATPase
VEASVGGRRIKVVSPGYLSDHGVAVPFLDTAGKPLTIVHLLEDETLVGSLGLADVVRAESREAVEGLHRLGIKAIMLTGDNETVARWVADELGLDEFYAGVLPEHKVDQIKELQKKGLVVALVGDGVNDAPADLLLRGGRPS